MIRLPPTTRRISPSTDQITVESLMGGRGRWGDASAGSGALRAEANRACQQGRLPASRGRHMGVSKWRTRPAWGVRNG